MDPVARTSTTAASTAAPANDLDGHPDARELPRVRGFAVALLALCVAAGLAGLFFLGWTPRKERLERLAAETTGRDDRPIVKLAHPARSARPIDLTLPADVRSMQQTVIEARANGYLKRLLVDLGDKVTEGQLLAEIDAPEIDAELEHALAGVSLAEANLVKARNDKELASETLKRYEGYGESGGVTAQQLDEKRAAASQAAAAFDAATASVAVARSDVTRFRTLQDFRKITAPFSGTITARDKDRGALLAPTASSSGNELFRLEQTDVLRVFVNVPQSYATSLALGDAAALTVPNWGDREFTGVIARSAGALDPVMRTLRYEIDVQNREGLLFAGMYGSVKLKITPRQPPTTIPTSALLVDAAGPQVWIVQERRVHRRSVTLGIDFGTEIEVLNGLTADDAVVANPSDRLVEEREVRVAEEAAAGGGSAGATGPAR